MRAPIAKAMAGDVEVIVVRGAGRVYLADENGR